MVPDRHATAHDLIPDADLVRQRLAAVLTEADLLRSQLRVSRRLERERERLSGAAAVVCEQEDSTHAS
jgi:hypothetical protein